MRPHVDIYITVGRVSSDPLQALVNANVVHMGLSIDP